jgi:hypothetical protein
MHLQRTAPQLLAITFLPAVRSPSGARPTKIATPAVALPPILKLVPPISVQGANAITVPLETDSPPIDWDSEAGLAVQHIVTRVEQGKAHRNLAGPSQAQLERSIKSTPDDSRHNAGDTEHVDGGLVTWVNDRCYYTTAGVSTSLTGRATLKVCKPKKSAPDGDLFKDMERKLDGRSIDAIP